MDVIVRVFQTSVSPPKTNPKPDGMLQRWRRKKNLTALIVFALISSRKRKRGQGGEFEGAWL